MIERMPRISNPLTIIAIFAAFAEIAGTVSLRLVDTSLRGIFVWFVMLFPVLLVVLFFLTLNYNPKVLYAPRDFRDEQNFITTVTGVFQKNSIIVRRETFGEVSKEFEDASAGGASVDEKRNNKAAHTFFRSIMMDKLKNDFESERLRSVKFGVKGEGFYFFELVVPEEIIKEGNSGNATYIIQVTPIGPGLVLRAIGENIQEDMPETFANKLYEKITAFFETSVDQEKLHEYRRWKKSSELGDTLGA